LFGPCVGAGLVGVEGLSARDGREGGDARGRGVVRGVLGGDVRARGLAPRRELDARGLLELLGPVVLEVVLVEELLARLHVRGGAQLLVLLRLHGPLLLLRLLLVRGRQQAPRLQQLSLLGSQAVRSREAPPLLADVVVVVAVLLHVLVSSEGLLALERPGSGAVRHIHLRCAAQLVRESYVLGFVPEKSFSVASSCLVLLVVSISFLFELIVIVFFFSSVELLLVLTYLRLEAANSVWFARLIQLISIILN